MSDVAPPPAFMDDEDAVPVLASRKPWIPHQPEQRLSIWVDRLLHDGLVGPIEATANHDSDEGKRTDQQRARDQQRGVKPGQVDWEVLQAGRFCRIELKRGDNRPTPRQIATLERTRRAGGFGFAAWTLRDVVEGLTAAGFVWQANIATTLQRHEANLAASDREAAAVRSGAVVRKRAPAKPRRDRYTGAGITTAMQIARWR